jgi:hypothetical protein
VERKCATCILCEKQNKVCRLSGARVNPDMDGCPKHTTELKKCEICGGNVLPRDTIIEIDEKEQVHEYCPNCLQLLKSCQSCPRARVCPFETDPNPMPKVVVQTIQQGNMTVQTQVRNEERERLFCHNCECWHEECGCLKNFNVGCNKKPNFWTSRNP